MLGTSHAVVRRLRGKALARLDRLVLERTGVLAARYAAYGAGEFPRYLLRWVSEDPQLLERTEIRDALVSATAELWWPPSRMEIPDEQTCERITDLFHRLYYYDQRRTWRNTAYRGVPIQNCPFDLWQYMEIVARIQPDLVIETSAKGGGTAYLLADVCAALGRGRVVTIDIEDSSDWPRHPRVTYWHGDSMDPVIVRRATDLAGTLETTMVIANSSHQADDVCRQLQAYAPLVTAGSYLIVESTNIHGHPVRPDLPAGPMEGVRRFLATTPDFEIAGEHHKFRLTFNPSGYLRRVRLPDTPD